MARKQKWSVGTAIVASLGMLLAMPIANAQSDSGGAVRLPYPSGMNQPVPSPVHATSWTVRRVTDKGRSLTVSSDAVVLFDWGSGVGESTASVFNGCVVSSRSFSWSDRNLQIAPALDPAMARDGATPCSAAQTALQVALSGTFTHPKASTFATGSVLVLTRSRTRVELVRRKESTLEGTAWRTTDTVVRSGQVRSGTLAFGRTRYSATDTCNSIDGHFLHLGDRLLAVSMRTTAAYCLAPPTLGWHWENATVTRSGDTITITDMVGMYTYRRVEALPWDTRSQQPSAVQSSATPPLNAAAVFGSWRMESLAGNRTGPGATGTIEFRSDATLVGETPCESFTGSWSPVATSMATNVRDFKRTAKTCDASLKPDALALGDLLATGLLAVGRGDIRLTLWRSGETDLAAGITFTKA